VNGVGDLWIEAIADAVAKRVERMAGCTQRLLNLDDAATYLGMTPAALRHKVRSGEITAVRSDARLRFDRRELDRFIDRAPREGV
jgi:excisionase family DNA binding protein